MNEDWHAGNESYPEQGSVSVGATSVLLVPRSENRISLIIGPPGTSSVFFSWNGDAASNNGIRITNGRDALLFNLRDHGALVKGPVYAICPGGTETITYIGAINTCKCPASRR